MPMALERSNIMPISSKNPKNDRFLSLEVRITGQVKVLGKYFIYQPGYNAKSNFSFKMMTNNQPQRLSRSSTSKYGTNFSLAAKNDRFTNINLLRSPAGTE